MSRHVLFLLASARRDGNTEILARQAASALPADTAQTWLRLAELGLPPVEDLRHDPARVGELGNRPTGVEGELFDATMAATDIVIALC